MPDEEWVEPDTEITEPVERRPVGRPAGAADGSRKGQNKAARKEQDKALKRLNGLEADLEPIIDQQVRLVQWHQESMTNQSTEGRSAKQRFLSEDDVKKLASLTKMVEGLGDLKIRWLAAAQKFGAGLTPNQVMEAAIARILSQPRDLRLRTLKRLYEEHNAMQRPGDLKAGASKPELDIKDERVDRAIANRPADWNKKKKPMDEIRELLEPTQVP